MAFTAIFFFWVVSSSLAQNPYFIFSQDLKVYTSPTDSLTRAWSGGFRSPMFSNFDANFDGVDDIFVFDRFDRTVSIFIYENGDYRYAPDYDYYFPPLTNWVFLRDYNCDGKRDIFASSFSGVQIWENTSTGGVISFSLETNFLQGTDGPVVVLSGDVPAIEDVDGDGDIDILSFEQSSQYVTYYRNNSSGCGLDYSVDTQCWGDFSEGGLSSSIALDDSCGGNRPASSSGIHNNAMHQGSTLMAFDNDGDGDLELLVGDISSNHVKLLTNGGNTSEAHITMVNDAFPLTDSIDIYVYPMTFMIDADNDGDKDLIASTAEISVSGGTNFDNTWLYENVSSTAVPNFTFRRKNFLTDKMMERGGGPTPHFYDFDHDGDMDLLIGSFSEKIDPFNLRATLSLYENIGSGGQMKLMLRDSDFGMLSDTLLYGLAPCTGDLDGDGDIDLLVGNNDGKLTYYENLSAPGVYPSFAAPQYYYQGLDIGFAASPYLFDRDRDGDLDLLIGEGNGNVNYFENIGTSAIPQFDMKTETFGKVDVQNPLFTAGYGYSTPYITQLDSNSNYDLVVGSYDGIVRIYLNIENYGIEDSLPFITNTYYNSSSHNYSDIKFGARTTPALSDVDGDGLADMVVGVFRGGLHFLKNNSDTFLIPIDEILPEIETSLHIFPNPAQENVSIVCDHAIAYIRLYSLEGKQVMQQHFQGNTDQILLNLHHLSKGVYHMQIGLSDPSMVIHRKLVRN